MEVTLNDTDYFEINYFEIIWIYLNEFDKFLKIIVIWIVPWTANCVSRQ